MQDEIVSRLANQHQTELIEIEARRSEHTPNPTAIDLELQGYALVLGEPMRSGSIPPACFLTRARARSG